MASTTVQIDTTDVRACVCEIERLLQVTSLPDHLRARLMVLPRLEGSSLINLEHTSHGLVARPDGELLAILANLRALNLTQQRYEEN